MATKKISSSNNKQLKVLTVIVGVLTVIVMVLVFTSFYLWLGIKEADSKREFEQLVLDARLGAEDRWQRPVVDPKEQKMYIPELKLTLPYNDTTKYLTYDYYDGDMRVKSLLVTDKRLSRMSCSDMVRLKIEDTPNEYSPEQKHYATVQLSNGTKLQVYVSSFDECGDAWAPVNPKDIAQQFKSAQNY